MPKEEWTEPSSSIPTRTTSPNHSASLTVIAGVCASVVKSLIIAFPSTLIGSFTHDAEQRSNVHPPNGIICNSYVLHPFTNATKEVMKYMGIAFRETYFSHTWTSGDKFWLHFRISYIGLIKILKGTTDILPHHVIVYIVIRFSEKF